MAPSGRMSGMTDIPSDAIQAAVAIGTGGLALATFMTLRDSRRTSQDAAAPRIIVSRLFSTEVETGKYGVETKPGSEWDLTQFPGTNLALGARALLGNEGFSTGYFTISCDEAEVSKVAPRPTEDSSLLLADQAGAYILTPGAEASVEFLWWRSAEEWAKGQEPGADLPVATVKMKVRGALEGGPVDECTLRFGAAIFTEREGRTVFADIGSEGYLASPLEISEIGPLRRTYPKRRLLGR